LKRKKVLIKIKTEKKRIDKINKSDKLRNKGMFKKEKKKINL